MKTLLGMLWALPLFLLAAGVTPVEAFTLQAGGNAPYLCATASNGATGNGTPVVLTYCSGAPDQQWNWASGQIQGPTANGIYCLDNLWGAYASPGQAVYLNPCSSSTSQQWTLGLANEGRVLSYDGFGTEPASLCLDSVGGPNVGGNTQLVINGCGPSDTQNWNMQRMEISLESIYPYQCISLEGGSITPGTYAVVSSCNGSASQRWSFQNTSLMGLGSWNGNSMCLEPAGSYVTLGSCTPQWTTFQQFAPSAIIDTSTFTFCLDAAGAAAPGGGTYLVLTDCYPGVATQNWVLR